jgi:hypothetical protein
MSHVNCGGTFQHGTTMGDYKRIAYTRDITFDPKAQIDVFTCDKCGRKAQILVTVKANNDSKVFGRNHS